MFTEGVDGENAPNFVPKASETFAEIQLLSDVCLTLATWRHMLK